MGYYLLFENAFVTTDLTGRPCGIRNVVHGCAPDFTVAAAGLYTNRRQNEGNDYLCKNGTMVQSGPE